MDKADALGRKAEEKTDARGVSKVFCPLPSAKQIPLTTWKSKSAKEGDEGWPVPIMVGLEGLRMEITSPDTPLARWRINLRECLSYTILVNCPDTMSHDVNKDWTDMQCIGVLEKLQSEYHLHEGAIPASVFAVAINHFTARAWDEGQKASQSAEQGGQPTPITHESVESWGLRPRLLTPQFIRKRKIILLTNSGAMIYRRPPKKGTGQKVKPDKYFNNETCTDPWSNIIANYEVGGAGWARWADFFQYFVIQHGALMEMCPDGEKVFPFTCVGGCA